MPLALHIWYGVHGCVARWVLTVVNQKPSWCRRNWEYHELPVPIHSQLRGLFNIVRLAVSTLWCRPGTTHEWIILQLPEL